jgi:hypothetical protein
MKWIKLFEDYMNFIGSGVDHEVYDLNDKWVLKIPSKHGMPNYTSDILEEFDYHIKFMQKYPNFFPKIKRLDKYRAAIEKMDTNKAKEEISHLFNYLKYESNEGPIWTIVNIDESDSDLEKLKNGDDICKKWYSFIKELHNEFGKSAFELGIDNWGIDKNGNIKLIDF